MKFRKVTHCIFDMDGLLLDTETVYDRILQEIAEMYGKRFSPQVKVKLLGLVELDTAIVAVKEMDLPITPEEFLKIYSKKTEAYQKHPKMMPGAKELVKHLYKHEIPICVATSASQSIMEMKAIDHQDVFRLFSHVVCGSSDPEVKNGKPAPDIFLVAARRFKDNPHPSKCLVFEDAPNGALGASRAGMQSVLVPPDAVPHELREHGTLVLNSLKDFKPELFGLPPFEYKKN